MPFDDPACFRLDRTQFGPSTGCGGRTWPAASRPFGVVARHVRKDG